MRNRNKSSLETHSRKINGEGLSRRRFLGFIATTAVIAAADRIVNEPPKEHARIDIKALDDKEAKQNFPHTAWIFLPGFNTSWDDSERYMKALQPTLRERGQMARIGYSNNGLDTSDLYDKLLGYARGNNLTTLNLYGHSFGGMLSVQIAARLRSDDIHVPLIALDSSPSSASDVIDRTQFDWLSASDKARVPIPTSLRLGAVAISQVGNSKTLAQAYDEALQSISPDKCSTALLQSEAGYIATFTPGTYDGLLGDTKITHLGNPADTTVNYQSARQGWQQALPHNFIDTPHITYGAGHGDPDGSRAIYTAQMSIIQDQFLPLQPSPLTRYN
jgi:pimeloyl-ACP methyl ester carboxylesterase